MGDAAEVNIDMNKPCVKCGQMGATGSGVCVECASESVVNWERLVGEALAAGNANVHKLLTEHLPQVYRAYLMSEDRKLSIGISMELAPSDEMPNTIVVRSKINFIESRIRDEKTTRVSAQQPLPL